jgi:hypothetical protein
MGLARVCHASLEQGMPSLCNGKFDTFTISLVYLGSISVSLIKLKVLRIRAAEVQQNALLSRFGLRGRTERTADGFWRLQLWSWWL